MPVAKNNSEVQGIEDLAGKRAAQNLTSSWGQMAESYGAELVGVESMNQSVELILTGRADVTMNAETVFYDFMINQPYQAVKIAAMTDTTTSSVVCGILRGHVIYSDHAADYPAPGVKDCVSARTYEPGKKN